MKLVLFVQHLKYICYKIISFFCSSSSGLQGGRVFFNAVKEGDLVMFACDDEQDRVLWVQAMYRATGQSYKPVPPPQNKTTNCRGGNQKPASPISKFRFWWRLNIRCFWTGEHVSVCDSAHDSGRRVQLYPLTLRHEDGEKRKSFHHSSFFTSSQLLLLFLTMLPS